MIEELKNELAALKKAPLLMKAAKGEALMGQLIAVIENQQLEIEALKNGE